MKRFVKCKQCPCAMSMGVVTFWGEKWLKEKWAKSELWDRKGNRKAIVTVMTPCLLLSFHFLFFHYFSITISFTSGTLSLSCWQRSKMSVICTERESKEGNNKWREIRMKSVTDSLHLHFFSLLLEGSRRLSLFLPSLHSWHGTSFSWS